MWVVAGIAAAVGPAACGGSGSDDSGSSGGPEAVPAALALLASSPAPANPDRFEVWICHVPDDTTDPVYVPGGARLTLTPEDVATRVSTSVPAYFDALSHGAHTIELVPGGEVSLAAGDGHQRCAEEALDRSGPDADAVLVVADAEHRADEPGGTGQAGTGCDCPAAEGRRFAYVGASDFHPDWGPTPALDLVEHEIGHTLGLPHSGDAGSDDYTSALDVMSDSAAPRAVDPSRRDGPATIAANLIALGWLPLTDVAVVGSTGDAITADTAGGPLGSDDADAGGGRNVTLRPSTSDRGTRAVVIPLDGYRLLTAELLTPDGLDAHLPAAGVAVHLIDQSPSACGHAGDAACTGVERRQIVLTGRSPHTDLLTAGEQLTTDGWTIAVESIEGGEATLALTPTGR